MGFTGAHFGWRIFSHFESTWSPPRTSYRIWALVSSSKKEICKIQWFHQISFPSLLFFLKYLFIYLAALSLSWVTWALLLHRAGSPVVVLPCGTWDLSSLIRNQTHVPCIARQMLNHWTTGEVPSFSSPSGEGDLGRCGRWRACRELSFCPGAGSAECTSCSGD